MQSMNDAPVYYFDDAGNQLVVRGTSVDYALLTDLEADLEVMVTMQTLTGVAQEKARMQAEKAVASFPRIHTGRA